ncbi:MULTISPECIES: CPBP family intramembrane glutamic endopeptidase [Halorussus]|uniref:CPBP family intramembrane glutamic endopeptidase n=1 Tax=Halorussus TaxID=1070314 RepID=UPI00209CA85B|nr:type II CAAX endopeptidase family protein [Halorussus vallis]USZ77342.1 CPBP family intramembrane metalloprotease [Halorussus vallis]
MEDRSAASVGVVLAGIALAAAALPWGDAVGAGPAENAVLALLGLSAFAAFSLRRHGLLGSNPGAALAGVASFAVVGYVVLALSGVVAGGGAGVSPWGIGLALVGGVGGVIAAYGDGRGISARVQKGLVATARSLVIGFSGLLAIAVWASVLVTLLAAVVPSVGTASRLAVSAVALGLGTATVASVYFRLADKTLAYLDFRKPTLRDLGYVVVGSVALFGLQMVVSIVFSQFGLSTASHSVEQTARGGNADILLLLIPASWLIIGPGEELLYRNIIQKSLYDTFGEWGAVLVASVVFSLAHVFAYAGGSSLFALFNTLVVIFFLSLVLGATYLLTENTTVSALIHGTFDAVVFAALWFRLSGASAAALFPW